MLLEISSSSLLYRILRYEVLGEMTDGLELVEVAPKFDTLLSSIILIKHGSGSVSSAKLKTVHETRGKTQLLY